MVKGEEKEGKKRDGRIEARLENRRERGKRKERKFC